MEVVALSIAAALMALALVALCSVVPFVLWRLFKLEAKVEALDEVLSEALGSAGVPQASKNGQVSERQRSQQRS